MRTDATQPPLIFHDTVPLDEQDLPQAREIAKKQRERILSFFKRYKDENWTPAEVHSFILGQKIDVENSSFKKYPLILLTSVRRSITDLTKEGRLIKCQWSERRKGRYGRDNRTWRHNAEYIAPITPQSKTGIDYRHHHMIEEY